MMRIKLFGLFIAFALLALVRPRKCLELLEAADAGAAAKNEKDVRDRMNKLVQRAPSLSETQQARLDERRKWSFGKWAAHVGAWENPEGEMVFGSPMAVRAMLIQYGETLLDMVASDAKAQECTLPPPGWRCTRAAGHEGPCAAVVK